MWWLIGLAVVSFIALVLLRPPPPDPPAIDDEADAPKVQEGDVLGRLYGTGWIKDPQVHWFGDKRTEAIKEKGGKK